MILALLGFKAFIIPLHEGYAAVITRLGKPVKTISEPGPHFIWPWPIGKAYIFDARNRVYNTKFTQTLTKDKKSIILLTYIVWKIDDPLVFLQSVGNVINAERKLDSLVSSAKNNVIGGFELMNLVSTNAEQLKLKQIEDLIKGDVAASARENFGIGISELGIKRLAYPENNVAAIFDQMRAERNQSASKYRAEGRMKASMILSETELQIAEIKAEAGKKAALIKGQADREATEIIAKAHLEGKDYFKFIKSLEAATKMSGPGSVFMLRSDQPPFNTLLEDMKEAD
jgi:membrane protease subunit HflC